MERAVLLGGRRKEKCRCSEDEATDDDHSRVQGSRESKTCHHHHNNNNNHIHLSLSFSLSHSRSLSPMISPIPISSSVPSSIHTTSQSSLSLPLSPYLHDPDPAIIGRGGPVLVSSAGDSLGTVDRRAVACRSAHAGDAVQAAGCRRGEQAPASCRG